MVVFSILPPPLALSSQPWVHFVIIHVGWGVSACNRTVEDGGVRAERSCHDWLRDYCSVAWKKIYVGMGVCMLFSAIIPALWAYKTSYTQLVWVVFGIVPPLHLFFILPCLCVFFGVTCRCQLNCHSRMRSKKLTHTDDTFIWFSCGVCSCQWDGYLAFVLLAIVVSTSWLK